MARIRSIHPGLSSDEAYMSMSMTAKAAWPHLWMECDDHGVFEWKPIVLKARIFPADNVDFPALLEEFKRLECVKMVEIAGRQCGLVRNFCRFQRPKKPSYRHLLPDEFRTYVGIGAPSSPPVPHHSPTSTENSSQMEDGVGVSKKEPSQEGEPIKGTYRPPMRVVDGGAQ